MSEEPLPGPRCWFAANLGWLRDPAGYHARQRQRFGDPLGGWLGRLRLALTGSPAGVRQVFAAPLDTYAPVGVDLAGMLGAEALPVLEGAAHLALRRRVNAVLLEGEAAQAGPAILAIARAEIAAWPRGRAMPAGPLLQRLSFAVIMRVVFGVIAPGRAEAYRAAFARLARHAGIGLVLLPALRRDLGPWSPWRRFLEARATVHRLIAEDLAAARASSDAARFDTLARLAALREADGAPSLSDAAIRDTLVVLLSAGHESTAAAMAWALLHCWATPGVLPRLRAELDGCDGAAASLLRLPFLEACAREALRIAPVAPMMVRQLARPMTLAGHDLPAGMLVGASAELAHADPAVFPEPEKFRPERFLDARFRAHEFFPFGGGRRLCPGARLALEEIRLVLAVLARTPGLALADHRPPRRVFSGPLLAPSRGGPRILLQEQAT
ncbi:cytochrome P450 [Roseomonas sp. 18066]|uniref:cytochrome P450 n=1 Tax=Roseomonas sp. 18066 TaxID=2681412 RepID=UPI00135B73B8|nr:cytochrome P450 [Roseomonas sp. 18066]